jgi:hypothetical protein
MISYKDLPGHSRVWVYQSNREFTAEEVEEIKAKGDVFIFQWAAHGKDLKAAFEIFYNRFIVLFVDEQQAMASGCSIDSSVHFVQQIEVHYKVDLMDRMIITYKKDDQIAETRLPNFDELFKDGTINEDTVVFNNLVDTQEKFVSEWEVPVKNSWHKQLIPN